MKCHEVMELMQRYLDQDLSKLEEQAMKDHLHDCPGCTALFERFVYLSSELEKLPKVAPPVSLVDSILPRLEQIDRSEAAALAHESNDVSGGTARTSDRAVAWRQRWKERFPYKSVGGVVAAGIVLGMFMVNGNPFQQNTQVADQANNEAAGGISLFSSAENKATESTNDSEEAVPQAQESAVDKDVSSSDVYSTDSAADAAVTSKQSEKLKIADSNNSAQANGDSGSSPGYTGTGEPAAADEPEGKKRMAAPEQPSASAGQDPLESARAVEEPPQEKVEGDRSVANNAFTVEENGSASLDSPDGAYNAVVEGKQVIIMEDTERIFITPAREVDQILNLKWSEDSKFLDYDTASGESIGHYRIDVTHKIETAQ